jgi:hypothetical protein
MGERKLRVAATVLLALTLSCGSALAAPPADPPGKSGDAPGHQKEPGTPAEPTAKTPEPVDAPAADVAPPTVLQAPPPAPDSARFANAAGKPKHNVPAVAEAAPEASVSAPGNSGRHKITICHKGHAITVDVHAATAHVDGHGDNYAVAGAKGRAACPHSSGPTPHNETPSGPGADRPDVPAAAAATGRRTNDPVAPHDPATGRPGGSGASETSKEQSVAALSGVAGAAGGGSLPFTGGQLDLLMLCGIALVGGGLLLRCASLGWRPRRPPTP